MFLRFPATASQTGPSACGAEPIPISGRVFLDPAIERLMVCVDTARFRHLLDPQVTDPGGDMPAHAP
jgi:hypothetical protein